MWHKNRSAFINCGTNNLLHISKATTGFINILTCTPKLLLFRRFVATYFFEGPKYLTSNKLRKQKQELGAKFDKIIVVYIVREEIKMMHQNGKD